MMQTGGEMNTYTAASTKDCMLIWELTSQWPGGVKGLRELQHHEDVNTHTHVQFTKTATTHSLACIACKHFVTFSCAFVWSSRQHSVNAIFKSLRENDTRGMGL
jgi:hypothetical protein